MDSAILISSTVKDGQHIFKISVPRLPQATSWYSDCQLLLVGIDSSGEVAAASIIPVTVSSRTWSAVGTFVALVVVMILVFQATKENGLKAALRGPNGRVSLAYVQVAWFSLVVFAVSTYLFLRTGTLGDLSEDVLLLMGISIGGAAGAKVGDRFTQRLEWKNWIFLKTRLEWLEDEQAPAWGQLLRDNTGQFDIFRAQAFMFSLLVGMGLFIAGANGLSSFELPEAILGVLGLSQITYIGGKAVAVPKFSEFDGLLKAYRELVKDEKDPKEPGSKEAEKALKELRSSFEAVYGYAPPE